MGVKPGYKQTEVGVIPQDWEVINLGDICRIRTGKRDVNEGNHDGHIPFFTCSRDHTFSDNYSFDTEAILVAGNGEVGNLQYFSGKFEAYQRTYVLSDFNTNVRFLWHQLNAYLRPSLGIGTIGSSIPYIKRENLSRFKFSLPIFPAEQEAIAEALSDADTLIESLEQLLTKKRQIKKGAMQDLLTGKKRLPGFNGEWESVDLGSIVDTNQQWSFTGGPFGSNLKSSDYTDGGVRIIQLQNIGDGEFKNDYEIYTSRQKADELLSCNIYPGEIILSKMGDPVARACIIPPLQERYVMCSDGIRLAVDEKRFNTYFVYTQINAPEFRVKASNASTGSTRKRIGLTELRRLELWCPPHPEQTAIAAILSDMDAEIAALEAKLSKARQLKQGMMQELLTGRIRLI